MLRCDYCGNTLGVRSDAQGSSALYCDHHGTYFIRPLLAPLTVGGSTQTNVREIRMPTIAAVKKRKDCEDQLCGALIDLSILVIENIGLMARGEVTDCKAARLAISDSYMAVDHLLTRLGLLVEMESTESGVSP